MHRRHKLWELVLMAGSLGACGTAAKDSETIETIETIETLEVIETIEVIAGAEQKTAAIADTEPSQTVERADLVAHRSSDCRSAACTDDPSYYGNRYGTCRAHGRSHDYCAKWVGCAGDLTFGSAVVHLGGELCEASCAGIKDPCQHGRCSIRDGNYACTCFAGYEGDRCDKQVDLCPDDPNKLSPGACGCGTPEGCNHAPIASDDAASTVALQSVNIDVLANDLDLDGDALHVRDISPPNPSGKVSLSTDGSIVFSPGHPFSRRVTFEYTVADTNGKTDTARVVVTVTLEGSDGDFDHDGIADDDEIAFGYDPTDADSDDDGIKDRDEDIDADGVLDPDETSPIDPDTDHNGLCDGTRVADVAGIAGAAGATGANDQDSNSSANGGTSEHAEVFVPPSDCVGQQVIFVDASAQSSGASSASSPLSSPTTSAPATGDGRSWATAYSRLEDIANAVAGQEVWVATGTYRPSIEKTAVLTMIEGVSVFGGFSGLRGAAETSRAQRDAKSLHTVLDGDLTADGPTPDDACHVVVGASNARLSGFVVTHGNATCSNGNGNDDYGAGMLNLTVENLHVDNTVFIANQSIAGAIFTQGAEMSFQDVAIIGNTGSMAGSGLADAASALTIANVAFVANTDTGNAEGGGFDTVWLSDIVMDRVNFSRNSAARGGAMAIANAGARLNEVTFAANGNAATEAGGGVYATGADLILTNVAFIGNQTDIRSGQGGAVFIADSPAVLTNVSFTHNQGSMGGGLFKDGAQTPRVMNSAFWDNAGGDIHDNARANSPNGSATIAVLNTCSQDVLDGAALVQLDADPFVTPYASPQVFLSESANDPRCFNLGDDNDATTAGIDWSNQTTTLSGALDADSGDGLTTGHDVDAGRHHHPSAVVIEHFAVGYATLEWRVRRADRCILTNDADWSLYLASAPNAPTPTQTEIQTQTQTQTQTHQYLPPTEFFLICFGDVGEPAVAWAKVPLP